jgi:hypothetical protein
MAEIRVGVKVADDRQSVTIQIGPTGGASQPISLSLDQLTKLIQLLGHARSQMVNGTPKQPLEGKTVETVFEPPWYVQVASIDGSLLAFDHPSYGPVAFAVPRNGIARIVRTLNEHLALPATRRDKPS